MRSIANTTLIVIDCVDSARAERALAKSLEQCWFPRVLFLTSLETSSPYAVKIPPIDSLRAYSEFVVCRLHAFIETSHALIIQWDGWVCNGEAWTDDWLRFDYVGGNASWTADEGGGNGGFSLRSRRLLEAGARHIHPSFGCHPEDVYFSSSTHGRKTGRRALFEADGFLFATRDVQHSFCTERTVWAGEFGHHKCDLGALSAAKISDRVYGFRLVHLGDHWAFINWALKRAARGGITLRVSRYFEGIDYGDRFLEIAALIESDSRLEIVDDEATDLAPVYEVYGAESYLPTKVRWSGGSAVCCQLQGREAERNKNPPPYELNTLGMWVDRHHGVRLDDQLTLAECVDVLAHSSLFIGVCSGMSHLAHSVGVPTFIIEYQKTVKPFHLGKTYVRCHGTTDAIDKADAFLKGSP